MSGLRLLWAIFLAGLVGFCFVRSWAVEQGQPLSLDRDTDRGRETFIWISPLLLPILMLSFFALFLILYGPARGLARCSALALDVTVAVSLYDLLLLILLPLLRKTFSARACATLWLVPVFLFYQANLLVRTAYPPRIIFYIPQAALDWIFPVWLLGFAGIFLGRVVEHLRFRRSLLAASALVEDADTLNIWVEELTWADYRRPVKLVRSGNARAPLSMGLTRRSLLVILPERAYSPEALRWIFRHEIRHLQRRDVDTKVFLAFCGALCWFNPLVWIALRKASDDLELSCDEMVLSDADAAERNQYAQLLLRTAGDARGFSTCLSAAAGSLRYRLKNAVAPRTRRMGVLLLSAAMFLCALGYGAAAVASRRGALRELVFAGNPAGFDAESVYLNDGSAESGWSSTNWDTTALLERLSALEADELYSLNEPTEESQPKLELLLYGPDGGWVLMLSEHLLTTAPLGKQDGRNVRCYLLRSPVDWDALAACRR